MFGNYRPKQATQQALPPLAEGEGRSEGAGTARPLTGAATLPSSIDLAVARSFLYRFLAKAFEDPTPEGWQWLCDPNTQAAWQSAVTAAWQSSAGVPPAPAESEAYPPFRADAFDSFHSAYGAAFGHAARGGCPLNEIEYGDLKADPLFQPHRLADLAAFYRAFGLEVANDAGERHDHICLELEFMTVLAAKEAFALEQQLGAGELPLCRDAQKKFLREHLGRWMPAFTRRLARLAGETALGALADFTREFIAADCARFGVTPGSEDLLLRPIDESSETLCASCGITNLPPGATGAPASI